MDTSVGHSLRNTASPQSRIEMIQTLGLVPVRTGLFLVHFYFRVVALWVPNTSLVVSCDLHTLTGFEFQSLSMIDLLYLGIGNRHSLPQGENTRLTPMGCSSPLNLDTTNSLSFLNSAYIFFKKIVQYF